MLLMNDPINPSKRTTHIVNSPSFYEDVESIIGRKIEINGIDNTVKYLLENVEYEVIKGLDDIEIGALVYDSRKVQPGDVFVCIKGAKWDAHDLIPQVIEAGAVAVVVEKALENNVLDDISDDVAVIKTNSTRNALACMSAAIPAQSTTKPGMGICRRFMATVTT